MSKTLISVVIATRNRTQLLREAIFSVQRQTAANWELIIVDDASNDETTRVVETFNDHRLRFFRLEKHAERSTARNFGLSQANGEFIMFLDDDDLLRRNNLQVLGNTLLENKDAVAAVGAQRTYTEAGYSARIFHPRKFVKREIWRELIFGWGAVSGQNLYRTDILRHINGFSDNFIPCEDRELWLKVAMCGKVCLVPETIFEYHIHQGQTGKPPNIKEIREAVFADFIRNLSGNEQKEAEKIRISARLAEKAEELRLQGDFGTARKLLFASFRTMPKIWFSPLLKTRLYYSLKDSIFGKTD